MGGKLSDAGVAFQLRHVGKADAQKTAASFLDK